MKRSLGEKPHQSFDDHHQQCKYSKIDAKLHDENLFSSDVLSIVFSFLDFDELIGCKLVNHQWNDTTRDDIRFELIYTVERELSSQFELNSDKESMTRLLVCVKQWLGARQFLLCFLNGIRISNSSKWYVRNRKLDEWLRNLWIRNEYPYLRVTKFEELYSSVEDFIVMNIHLAKDVILKMTAFYSIQEDIIIYVDVLSKGEDYDWKSKLNIDPDVKRNTVLCVNAKDFEDADCNIEIYEINELFFDCLFKELGIQPISKKKMSPFNTSLWGLVNYRDLGLAKHIKDVSFERNIEIHDDRANVLIDQFNLEKIQEVKVLQTAWKLASRVFTSVCESKRTKYQDISVTNVFGRIVTIDLARSPRRCADLSFNVSLNGETHHFELFFQQQFYYGHYGYESEARFKITGPPLWETMYIGVGGSILNWNINCNKDQIMDDVFKELKPTLLIIFKELLDIVPHYHILNEKCLVDKDELICFLIDHDNKF